MSRSNHTIQKPMMVTDRKAVITFGKYKGNTVQDILDNDPNYLVWLVTNVPDFDLHHTLLEEAEHNGWMERPEKRNGESFDGNL